MRETGRNREPARRLSSPPVLRARVPGGRRCCCRPDPRSGTPAMAAFGQTEVQAVRNGGERSIMAFISRAASFFRGVERDGSNFSVAGDAV